MRVRAVCNTNTVNNTLKYCITFACTIFILTALYVVFCVKKYGVLAAFILNSGIHVAIEE